MDAVRVTRFIANARMYAVAPEAEDAWRALLAHVAAEAEVELAYEPYPAPQPLEALWRRPDLGAVQMCGFPIATRLAEVEPLAAMIPALPWAEGRAAYRSDLIVRADAPFRTLADTYGERVGWTVEHSHSGFNALRHHLLARGARSDAPLYRESVGPLVTARRVLDAVLAGEIDVGPLDAYWRALIARWRPELTRGVRVLESTALAPMPAFVAAPALAEAARERLRQAFTAAAGRPWFAPFREALLLAGFAPASRDAFAPTLAWDAEARAAGYLAPE